MRSRRRPHRAALLGSTAESVCRNAPCPVLVMHHDQREFVNDELRVNLKRILVAYDFSDHAELGLNYALSITQEHQAELHLLHVLPPNSVSDPEIAWYPSAGESAYHNAARRLQRELERSVQAFARQGESLLGERLTQLGDAGALRAERKLGQVTAGLERQRDDFVASVTARLNEIEAEFRGRLSALAAEEETERAALDARLAEIARRIEQTLSRAEDRLGTLHGSPR